MATPVCDPSAASAKANQCLSPALPRGASLVALAVLVLPLAGSAESKSSQGNAAAKISYYREIRPILQANCQGCHQPAKSKGGYVMTEFKRLLAGGDNEGAAIVSKHPEQSSILKMVTPKDGEVRM